MANTKISEATAVVTPASTDEYATNQGGASKRTTRAQMHTLEIGEHLVLPSENDAVTPSLAFGDGDTGFYEVSDDVLGFVFAGTSKIKFTISTFKSLEVAGPSMELESSTSTNPVWSFEQDADTGSGKAGTDAFSNIAGAIEAQRFTEVSSKILTAVDASTAITANANSSQGDTPITSSFNVISVCATAGDAVTLPSTFTATIPSTIIYIKNDGAQSCDVFPASGDDAGAGTDTAVAIAAGDFAVFIATAASATWTKLMGGTA